MGGGVADKVAHVLAGHFSVGMDGVWLLGLFMVGPTAGCKNGRSQPHTIVN
jgi:hypothetical protein